MATKDEFLASYRKESPYLSDVSDDALLRSLASANYPGFDPSWAPAAPEPTPVQAEPAPVEQPDEGIFSNISRGFEVSARQVPQLAYGTAGLVGATTEKLFGVGASLKDWGFKAYKEAEAGQAPLARENDSLSKVWGKVKEGDLGALADWVEYGLGYGAGQAAEALAVSAIGGVIGSAAEPGGGTIAGAAGGLVAKNAVKQAAFGLVERAVAKEATKLAEEQLVKQGIKATAEAVAAEAAKSGIRKAAAKTVGSDLALLANSLVQEGGSIYGDALEQAKREGRELTGGDLARIWASAVVAGKVDAFGDKFGIDALKGKGIGKGVLGAIESAGVGAGTEAVQTGIERFGAQQSLTDNEALASYVDAAGLGGLSGGASRLAGAITGGGVEQAAQDTVAKPAGQQEAPPSERFDFNVDAPTIERDTYIAVAKVYDPTTDRIVESNPFFGATQEEAEVKRAEAGLAPAENMTEAQQAEYAAAIRAQNPKQEADALPAASIPQAAVEFLTSNGVTAQEIAALPAKFTRTAFADYHAATDPQARAAAFTAGTNAVIRELAVTAAKAAPVTEPVQPPPAVEQPAPVQAAPVKDIPVQAVPDQPEGLQPGEIASSTPASPAEQARPQEVANLPEPVAVPEAQTPAATETPAPAAAAPTVEPVTLPQAAPAVEPVTLPQADPNLTEDGRAINPPTTQRQELPTDSEIANSYQPYAVPKAQVDALINELGALGIKTTLVDAKAAIGGWYTDKQIAVAIDHINGPTNQTIRTMTHELVHHILENAPAGVRAAMQSSANQLFSIIEGRTDIDRRLQIPREQTNLTAEQWAEEVVAEAASLQGVNKAEARGFWQTVMRALKDLLIRSAMHLESKWLGREVSPERAAAFVNLQIERFLNRDASRFQGWLAGVGFINPTQRTITRMYQDSDDVWHSVNLDLSSGNIIHGSIHGLETQDIQHAVQMALENSKREMMLTGQWERDANIARAEEITGEPVTARQELNPPTNVSQASAQFHEVRNTVQAKIAVANTLKLPIERLFAAVKSAIPELTPAQRRYAEAAGIAVPQSVKDVAELSKILGSADHSRVASTAVEAATATLINELGAQGKPNAPADIAALFDQNMTIDSIPEDNKVLRDAALEELVLEIRKMTRRSSAGKARARSIEIDTEEALQRDREIGNKMLVDPRDWRKLSVGLAQNLTRSMEEIVGFADMLSDIDVALAESGEIMRSLLDEEARTTAVQDLTENLAEKISLGENINGVQGANLANIMKGIYQLGLDLETATPVEIRNAVIQAAQVEGSPLKAVTKNNRGTALLAAIIKFVKSDAVYSGIVEARLIENSENAKQLKEFRDMLEGRAPKLMSEFRQTLKEGKPLGNRYIQKFFNVEDRMARNVSTLAKAKRDLKVFTAADTMLQEIRRRAESNIGLSVVFVYRNGANYFVPPEANTPIKEIFEGANRKTVGVDSKTEVQKREDLAKIETWLAANKNNRAQRGLEYNILERTARELKANLHGDKVLGVLASVLGIRQRGFAEDLGTYGSRSGELMGRKVLDFVRLKNQTKSRSEVVAEGWEGAADKLAKQLGLPYERMRDEVYLPALTLAQHLKVNDEEGVMVAVDQLLKDKPEWNKPGVPAAFRSLLRETVKGVSFLNTVMKEAGGLDVSDDKLKTLDPATRREVIAFRRHLERGYITFPMHPADAIRRWARAVSVDYTPKAGRLTAAAFDPLVTTMDNIDRQFAGFLGSAGWDTFMEPLLRNDLGGVPAPGGGNLAVADANAAVDASGGTLSGFITAAFGDSEGNIEDYKAEVLSHIAGMWKSLSTTVGNEATDTNGMVIPGAPRFAMDARADATYPIEWRAPIMFGKTDMALHINAIAAQAAFGKQLEKFESLEHDMKQEMSALKNEILERAGVSTNLEAQAARQQLAKKALTSPKTFADLQRYKALEGAMKKKWTHEYLAKMLKHEELFTESPRVLLDVFSTTVTGMVSGIKNALKNPISLANIGLVQRELSLDSMSDIAGGYSDAAKYFVGGIADMFGLRILQNDPETKAINAAGNFDPATRTRLSDLVTGDRGKAGELSALSIALRRVRSIYTDARVSPLSYGSSLPAIRLLNPFQYTQVLVNMAAHKRLIKTYNEIYQKMIGYARDGGDLTKQVTAKDIGLRGSQNRMDALLKLYQDNGGDLQALARANAETKAGIQDIPAELVHAAGNIAVSYISAEGSIATSHPAFTRSALGKMAGVLIGWGPRQMNTTARVLADANNRRDAAVLWRGARALAILSLGALGASALLDEWDELTGRKKNKIALKDVNKDNVLEAYLAAMNEVGVFGPPMDLAQGFFNSASKASGQGPIISVDNRVVAISVMQNFAKAITNLYEVGIKNATYGANWRQFLNTFGGPGPFQNIDIVNTATGRSLEKIPLAGKLISFEKAAADRANIQNYVRVAAQKQDIPLKRAGGSTFVMSPVTPHVTDMLMASYLDDSEMFKAAYARAVAAAREDKGVNEFQAREVVKTRFATRNPITFPLQNKPTASEFKAMLADMPPAGRASVEEGYRLYSKYARSIGINPMFGAASSPAQIERATARSKGLSVEEWRKQRAGF